MSFEPVPEAVEKPAPEPKDGEGVLVGNWPTKEVLSKKEKPPDWPVARLEKGNTGKEVFLYEAGGEGFTASRLLRSSLLGVALGDKEKHTADRQDIEARLASGRRPPGAVWFPLPEEIDEQA